MKRMIKDYFTFSKKERTAVIILLLLIAVFIAAPHFYSPKFKPPVVNKALADYLSASKPLVAPGDSTAEENPASFYSSATADKPLKHETFAFDPNNATENDWKRLGISDRTIRTIINYRNKGGKFRTPQDLRKIWGIRKEDADRLIPFVQIEQPDFKTGYYPNYPQPVTRNKINTVDINTATVEEWEALPGIGEVIANRIIKFREKIGGFTSIEQVHKTYGISDSVFQKIKAFLTISQSKSSGLDLNQASVSDLQMMPGISEAVAKAIVIYRQQYGPYKSVSDLKKIVFINDTLYQKIASNLRVE
jgi:competence protein ComEA